MSTWDDNPPDTWVFAKATSKPIIGELRWVRNFQQLPSPYAAKVELRPTQVVWDGSHWICVEE